MSDLYALLPAGSDSPDGGFSPPPPPPPPADPSRVTGADGTVGPRSLRLSEQSLNWARSQYNKKLRMPQLYSPRQPSSRGSSEGASGRPASRGSSGGAPTPGGPLGGAAAGGRPPSARGGGVAAVRAAREGGGGGGGGVGAFFGGGGAPPSSSTRATPRGGGAEAFPLFPPFPFAPPMPPPFFFPQGMDGFPLAPFLPEGVPESGAFPSLPPSVPFPGLPPGMAFPGLPPGAAFPGGAFPGWPPFFGGLPMPMPPEAAALYSFAAAKAAASASASGAGAGAAAPPAADAPAEGSGGSGGGGEGGAPAAADAPAASPPQRAAATRGVASPSLRSVTSPPTAASAAAPAGPRHSAASPPRASPRSAAEPQPARAPLAAASPAAASSAAAAANRALEALAASPYRRAAHRSPSRLLSPGAASPGVARSPPPSVRGAPAPRAAAALTPYSPSPERAAGRVEALEAVGSALGAAVAAGIDSVRSGAGGGGITININFPGGAGDGDGNGDSLGAEGAAPPPRGSPTRTPLAPPAHLTTVDTVSSWYAAAPHGGAQAAPPAPPTHAYPLWFLLSLTRAICEEVEAAYGRSTLRALSSAAAAASAAAGGGGLSPVRGAMPPHAPLPDPEAWAVAHSASLTSAWLWLLQAARDLRSSAYAAGAWIGGGEGGGEGSPPPAQASVAAALRRAGEPFAALAQEDHVLRLLRRLPAGHLPPRSVLAVKTLVTRALLAAAGWGSLNDATATIMRLHLEEEFAPAAAASASAARRGSVFSPSSLAGGGGGGGDGAGSPTARASAAASPPSGVGGAGSPPAPQPPPAGDDDAPPDSVNAAFELVEAVLLEPLTVLPPASLAAFTVWGVDALGGAAGGVGGGLEGAHVTTPDIARAAMEAAVSAGGATAAPGASAGTLTSPSAGAYPFSYAHSSLFSPGGGATLEHHPVFTQAAGSPALTPSAAAAPGRFCFFGPQAWAALAYARARTANRGNLTSLLSTEETALAAHFAFIRGALKTAEDAAAGGGASAPPAAVASPASPAPPGAASSVQLSQSFLSTLTPEKGVLGGGDGLVGLPPAGEAADRGGEGAPSPAPAPASPAPGGADVAARRSAAVGAEVAAVVGRSLVREALAAPAADATAAPPPVGPGGVRFMLVLMTPDGRALLTEAETGAPLLLRSAAPMLEVELALGSLARAGRRQLGPAAAAAMQAEGAGQEAADAIASEILQSPPWSVAARNAAAAARAAASPSGDA
jgi:hypothetical protein